jgi:hypothetical protein
MPTVPNKFRRGVNVYLKSASDSAQRNGFRVVTEGNETIYYTCISSITYDGMNRKAIDVVASPTMEDLPPGCGYARIPLANLITIEDYQKGKLKGFKEELDPIDTGSIIVLNNLGERLIYGKVMNREKTKYGDQYEIITNGNNQAHVVNRSDISLPKEVYNVRDVLLKQPILDYDVGADAQIIGSFLYLGGDDILIHEKYAKNKKII